MYYRYDNHLLISRKSKNTHTLLHHTHPFAPLTPFCTTHTLLHHSHLSAPLTPFCTTHTLLHHSHPSAPLTPFCTTHTFLHHSHLSAPLTPFCTTHTFLHHPTIHNGIKKIANFQIITNQLNTISMQYALLFYIMLSDVFLFSSKNNITQ